MAAQYAFVMKDMTKTFPGAPKPVLANINLQFYQGAKIGIVGPNGAGKSTILKIVAGELEPDAGHAGWRGGDLGFHHQEAHLDVDRTLIEELWTAFPEARAVEGAPVEDHPAEALVIRRRRDEAAAARRDRGRARGLDGRSF